MRHPEFLLLPVLMFADYYGTILGAIQREKRYSAHFKMQHYEMNPAFQRVVGQKRWFSLRHLLLTTSASALVILLVEGMKLPDNIVEVMLGFFCLLYGTVIGRHAGNIFIFNHLIRNPSEISGQLELSHLYVLSLSLYQTLAIAVPVAMIAVFSPTPFTLGGALGVTYLVLLHLTWRRKAKRLKTVRSESETARAE